MQPDLEKKKKNGNYGEKLQTIKLYNSSTNKVQKKEIKYECSADNKIFFCCKAG